MNSEISYDAGEVVLRYLGSQRHIMTRYNYAARIAKKVVFAAAAVKPHGHAKTLIPHVSPFRAPWKLSLAILYPTTNGGSLQPRAFTSLSSPPAMSR